MIQSKVIQIFGKFLLQLLIVENQKLLLVLQIKLKNSLIFELYL